MTAVTSGKTGSLAMTSLNASPTLRHMPYQTFDPNIVRGDSVIPLANNVAFACNKVLGASKAIVGLAVPLIVGLHNADFFARLINSVAGDTDGANYHKLTLFPDNAGGSADTYDRCKLGTWMMGFQYAATGAGMMVGQQFTIQSIDPLSTNTGLTAPSAGAVTTAGIMSFAQIAVTGASDVVAGQVQISTELQEIGPAVAGTNSAYPYVPSGLLQTDLIGTVTLTQKRGTGTVLGASGSDGTLTLAFGTVGAGISFALELMPVATRKPSVLGPNYIQSTYALKSADGTSAVAFTDL